MADFDAIVVGSGHNGLICALLLARAGWRVLVVERSPDIGGGLRSGAVTLPGFVHDRYATNLAVFAASPAYRELKADFDRLGVRLLRSERSYASVHGKRALRVYTDTERTAREFGNILSCDADGWRELTAFYKRTAPLFLPLFGMECPSGAMGAQVARMIAAGPGDAMRLGRLAVQTSRAFARGFVQSAEARGLLVSWGYHLDFDPETPGGAVFAFVAALSAHVGGMAIVEGGAGRLTDALQSLIREAGGEIRTQTDVTRIIACSGKAVAVRAADAAEFSAGRAIIANVTTRNLFGKLLSPGDVAASIVRRAERYSYGPGTFILHLALGRMPDWRVADDLSAFNYVHLNGSEQEIAATYRQCLQGLLPDRPLLVVSQTTPIDGSRAPPGKHVMRVHVRTVPAQIAGDAAGRIAATSWSDARDAFAERLLDLVAEQAPDIRDCIIGRAIETPEEIEANNPNFVGADCVSGSHHLGQNFAFRPFFGWSRYATPLRGLFMTGASTWPGGGVNGSSGYLLARKLLASAAS
jgi:phytoene dehydrogenase-like protein